jgi:hypothetical protein
MSDIKEDPEIYLEHKEKLVKLYIHKFTNKFVRPNSLRRATPAKLYPKRGNIRLMENNFHLENFSESYAFSSSSSPERNGSKKIGKAPE